ncbi:MAG: hypothetical protein [Microvirus sp.]|nr:MAG: hypothetical protein [Microvirus sp.]
MRPVTRHAVSKRGSAKSFRKASSRTRAVNVQAGPMRGGIRL